MIRCSANGGHGRLFGSCEAAEASCQREEAGGSGGGILSTADHLQSILHRIITVGLDTGKGWWTRSEYYPICV